MDSIPLPSLRYLRVFETVARLESISRASVAIHLSQPAVTQAIAKLEKEIGESLFERRHSGTYLTEAGTIFRRRTQRLFEQMEEALRNFGVGAEGARKSDLNTEAGRITRTQIRAFEAIAGNESLERAARASGLSHTSLHRALRELESRLGRPLYRHTEHGIVATRAGGELARCMTLAMHEIECAINDLNAARGALRGRVAIGAQLLGSSSLIGAVATRFVQRFPDARVQIVSDAYESLLEQLRTGTIDYLVGLLRNPSALPDVVEEPLFSDPYVVVVRHGHPLTRLRKITLDDLARYDWVAPRKGAARRIAFDRLFARMKQPPRTSIETYSLTTLRTILAESNHATLLTRYEVSLEKLMGLLTSLPFGPLDPPASVAVTTRAGWLPTQVQREFLDLLRTNAKKLHDHAVPSQRVGRGVVAQVE